MSDFNSSLPVRTQNNGDVVVKVVDGTTTTQALAIDSTGRVVVKLDDGSGNVITSQASGAQRALDVGIDVAGVQVDPRAIRALTAADVITAQQGTSPWVSKDQADGPVTPGTVASFSNLAGIQFNTTLPTLTTGQQAALQSDNAGRLLVGSIFSPLPAGTNLLGGTNVYIGGTIASATNPVPVTVANAPSGVSVNNYNTTAALASAATSNHTYTITATKTFFGKKIWASSSGKMKAEVQISPDGTTFTTVWVGFNSTASPNITIDLDQLVFLESGTSSAIRIIRTNLDQQAQDVYSTISGSEV